MIWVGRAIGNMRQRDIWIFPCESLVLLWEFGKLTVIQDWRWLSQDWRSCASVSVFQCHSILRLYYNILFPHHHTSCRSCNFYSPYSNSIHLSLWREYNMDRCAMCVCRRHLNFKTNAQTHHDHAQVRPTSTMRSCYAAWNTLSFFLMIFSSK